MIKKLIINAKSGIEAKQGSEYYWASKVPYLVENPVVEFSDGLNIVFGPNGCGKSTLVGLCAYLTASEQGGRSKFTKSWMHNLFKHMGLSHNPPTLDDIVARLEFDGLPVFYHNPRNTIGLYRGVEFDDDFFKEGLLNLQADKGSVGEDSMRKLMTFFDNLVAEELPTVIEGDKWMSNHSSFKDDYKASMLLLKGTCKKGNRTFLMDEPEMGFSLLWQNNFWKNIVNDALKHKRQLIIATHSPFALNVEGANYIDMQKGYLDSCREHFKKAFGGI